MNNTIPLINSDMLEVKTGKEAREASAIDSLLPLQARFDHPRTEVKISKTFSSGQYFRAGPFVVETARYRNIEYHNSEMNYTNLLN